jgi:hypothetical protein
MKKHTSQKGSVLIVGLIVIVLILSVIIIQMIKSSSAKQRENSTPFASSTVSSSASALTPSTASTPSTSTPTSAISTTDSAIDTKNSVPATSQQGVTTFQDSKPHETNQTPATSFKVSGNTLSVIKDGKTLQTIALSQDAIQGLSVLSNDIEKFITNVDVNFDGHTDVGVFSSTAYGGVNDYYDFYIYNSRTSTLEKSATLVNISNPNVDVAKKQILSNYRSGPQWYTDVFQFNGTTYTKTTSSTF